jgi:hypothetical protein
MRTTLAYEATSTRSDGGAHADWSNKVFMVFGRDTEVAERYLKRVRPLTIPLEFYFLDGGGRRLL